MIVQVPTMGLTWFGRDCSETAEMSFFSQACKRLQSRKEKRRGMRTTSSMMCTALCTGQVCIECVLFCVSVILVCVSVAAGENVVRMENVEIGAHASVSCCALLLFAFLLPCLTLTGLARLVGLQSLVGLTMKLATSTA